MTQKRQKDGDLPPVADQNLKLPVALRGLNDGYGVTYYQNAFSLTEADFGHLKNGSTKTQWLASAIWGVWGGYALGLGPKIIDSVKEEKFLLATSEWQVLVVVFFIGALIWLAGLVFPNDRSKLLRRMKAHFENNPPGVRE